MKIPEIELTIEEGLEMAQDFLRKKGIVARVTKLDTDGYPLKGYVIKCEGNKNETAAPETPYESENIGETEDANKPYKSEPEIRVFAKEYGEETAPHTSHETHP